MENSVLSTSNIVCNINNNNNNTDVPDIQFYWFLLMNSRVRLSLFDISLPVSFQLISYAKQPMKLRIQFQLSALFFFANYLFCTH